MSKDYYEVLGVDKKATKTDIKKAYRKLAHKYHPDKGDGGDEKKFREVNEAYEILSNDQKRSQYDQFGSAFAQGSGGQAGGFGGFTGFNDFSDFVNNFGGASNKGPFQGFDFEFGDIFSDIFGASRSSRRDRGIDLEMNLEISFMDAVFGKEEEIKLDKKDVCEKCDGSGAEPGTKTIQCPKCHGQGQIITHHKTVLGNIRQAQTCDNCNGRGTVPEKECQTCNGQGAKQKKKTIKVVIPPGVENGTRLKVMGEGEIGYRGSKPGDLYIRISIKPHQEFSRRGQDIISEIPISFYQAALGAKIDAGTVDGKVELTIPAGIQSGKVLRLKNKGTPYINSKKRGDHLAIIRVVTPQKLTEKEKQAFRELAKENGETVDINKSLWDKIKEKFQE